MICLLNMFISELYHGVHFNIQIRSLTAISSMNSSTYDPHITSSRLAMDNSNEVSDLKKPKTYQNLHENLVLRSRHPKPRVGWNSLPAELRLEIYAYLIPRFDHAINVSSPKFENRFFREYCESMKDSFTEEEKAKRLPWTKILLINKQISHECLDILYGKNSFQIEMHKTGEADLRANFTRENRHRMRYITVAFLGTEGANFPPGNRIPDRCLWADILPNIREMWLVTVQPMRPLTPDIILPGDEFFAGESAIRFDQFFEWLPPYLRCFRELLRPDTVLYSMSGQDERETREIISGYFSWWY